MEKNREKLDIFEIIKEDAESYVLYGEDEFEIDYDNGVIIVKNFFDLDIDVKDFEKRENSFLALRVDGKDKNMEVKIYTRDIEPYSKDSPFKDKKGNIKAMPSDVGNSTIMIKAVLKGFFV